MTKHLKESLATPSRRTFLKATGNTLGLALTPTPVRMLTSTGSIKTPVTSIATAAPALQSIFHVALGWLRVEEQLTDNLENHQYMLETLRQPTHDQSDIEWLAQEIVNFRNERRWKLDDNQLLARCGELSDSTLLRTLSDQSCYVKKSLDYNAALERLAAAAQKGPKGIKRLLGIQQAQYQTMHAQINSYVSKNPRLQKEIARVENEQRLLNGEAYTTFGTAYNADEMCPIPLQDYYDDGKPSNWCERVSVLPAISKSHG
jgi:hypothetical protein